MSTTVHYHNVSAVQVQRGELDCDEDRKLVKLNIKIKGDDGKEHDIVIFAKSETSWTEATKHFNFRSIGETIIYEHAETNPF